MDGRRNGPLLRLQPCRQAGSRLHTVQYLNKGPAWRSTVSIEHINYSEWPSLKPFRTNQPLLFHLLHGHQLFTIFLSQSLLYDQPASILGRKPLLHYAINNAILKRFEDRAVQRLCFKSHKFTSSLSRVLSLLLSQQSFLFRNFKIKVVIFYFLIIVHLGESHILCRKSFLRSHRIVTSISPFAKWKKTGILTKFIWIFQTRSNNLHMYTVFYSIMCLKIGDSKHNVAR